MFLEPLGTLDNGHVATDSIERAVVFLFAEALDQGIEVMTTGQPKADHIVPFTQVVLFVFDCTQFEAHLLVDLGECRGGRFTLASELEACGHLLFLCEVVVDIERCVGA